MSGRMSNTVLRDEAKALAETEQSMFRKIQAKFSETNGNGEAFAVIPQVRNAAGFDATRTADAIVMSLWPSRGLTLSGFEIKVSRGDWVRELRKPEKAEVFCAIVDYWWLVVSDKSIVQDGELPENWGLMVPHGKGLKVAVQATALRPPVGRPPIDRSFLAALLRSACRVSAAGPVEIQEAVAAERAAANEEFARWKELSEQQLLEQRQRIQNFEREAGFSIDDRFGYRFGDKQIDSAEMGRLVRTILSGERDTGSLETRLRTVRRMAEEIIQTTDQLLPETPG